MYDSTADQHLVKESDPMPNNNPPPKPAPDPAKGTGTKPGTVPKNRPTPDGNDQPPQTR